MTLPQENLFCQSDGKACRPPTLPLKLCAGLPVHKQASSAAEASLQRSCHGSTDWAALVPGPRWLFVLRAFTKSARVHTKMHATPLSSESQFPFRFALFRGTLGRDHARTSVKAAPKVSWLLNLSEHVLRHLRKVWALRRGRLWQAFHCLHAQALDAISRSLLRSSGKQVPEDLPSYLMRLVLLKLSSRAKPAAGCWQLQQSIGPTLAF